MKGLAMRQLCLAAVLFAHPCASVQLRGWLTELSAAEAVQSKSNAKDAALLDVPGEVTWNGPLDQTGWNNLPVPPRQLGPAWTHNVQTKEDAEKVQKAWNGKKANEQGLRKGCRDHRACGLQGYDAAKAKAARATGPRIAKDAARAAADKKAAYVFAVARQKEENAAMQAAAAPAEQAAAAATRRAAAEQAAAEQAAAAQAAAKITAAAMVTAAPKAKLVKGTPRKVSAAKVAEMLPPYMQDQTPTAKVTAAKVTTAKVTAAKVTAVKVTAAKVTTAAPKATIAIEKAPTEKKKASSSGWASYLPWNWGSTTNSMSAVQGQSYLTSEALFESSM